MKKAIIVLAVLVLLISYPLHNFVELSAATEAKGEETEKGIEIVENYYDCDIQQIEQKINTVQKNRSLRFGGTEKEINEVLSRVDNGEITLRKVFSKVYIVGDSLMNGLELYGILNPNNLITQVSASLYHLADNVNTVIGMNPPVLILHYGINMISTSQADRSNFINYYTSLITELKQSLPDTRFIVSGLFPVDRSIATDARFADVELYNSELRRMCDGLEIEFLDSTQLLKAHSEYYGSDGIHLSKAFYEEYWLKFIIKEKGIVG